MEVTRHRKQGICLAVLLCWKRYLSRQMENSSRHESIIESSSKNVDELLIRRFLLSVPLRYKEGPQGLIFVTFGSSARLFILKAGIMARGKAGGGSSGQDETVDVSNISKLQDEVATLTEMVRLQQETISRLSETRNSDSSRTQMTSTRQGLNTPSIAIYSGKKEEKCTTKILGFLCSVRKNGKYGKLTDRQTLELAECHLRDGAATWYMGLEKNGETPGTMDDLQKAMIREFVPEDEKAQTKVKLMNLKFCGSMENHINNFKKLVAACETPLSESYLFFFMSLPPMYKEEFTKKYPGASPKDMKTVYNEARTLELSKKWAGKPTKNSTQDSSSGRAPPKKEQSSKRSDVSKKNDSLETWGKARKGELGLYKKANRCYRCGVKGWTTDHKCGQTSEQPADPKE